MKLVAELDLHETRIVAAGSVVWKVTYCSFALRCRPELRVLTRREPGAVWA